MATCTLPTPINNLILTSSTAAEPGVGEVAFNIAATYAVGDKAIVGAPTSVVTITIASPGVVTWASHGLPNGTEVTFTTTGALPTGLAAGVIYYVVNRAAGTFQVSATPGGAPVVTTGSQSGTHTAKASIHRMFESTADTNSGNHPAIDNGSKWIDIGPTNQWAMLDLYRNSRTWAASPLTVVLTPGKRVNSLFLGALVANSVTVSITSGGVPVYSRTIDLNTRRSRGWYAYYFGDFKTRQTTLLQDLPPYTNAVITVTITRTEGDVGVGALVIGNFQYLGRTQYGASSKARNYSRIDRTFDGTASITRRRNVPTSDQVIWFEKALTQDLLDLRDATNATPAVWSGIDDEADDYFPAVTILGFPTTFDLNIDQPTHGVLNATFEEV